MHKLTIHFLFENIIIPEWLFPNTFQNAQTINQSLFCHVAYLQNEEYMLSFISSKYNMSEKLENSLLRIPY